MKKQILVLAAVLLSFSIQTSYAQSPCATLTVTPSQPAMIPCDSNTNVNISFQAAINLSFPVNETSTYTVDTIPYAPLPWVGANVVLNGSDDLWSNTVKLPFPFCFFGNTYEYYVIGANGRISFDTTLAGTFDNFSTNGPPPITAPDPDPNYDMNNTIMAAYHDIDPSVGGSITWDTFGVSPCRTMVINWTSVPMFSCTGLIDSQQIVLYELSNVIDINLANKPVCNNWNSGLALQGIQNSTGTVAYTAPGRNNTVWVANNDSRRFAPSGAPYVFTTTYTWRDGTTNAVLGTGSSLTVSTPFPNSVVCEAAIFGGCTNDTTFARDTTFFMPGKVQADFDMDVRLGCKNDTVVFTNKSVPLSPTTYFWDFGDANFDYTVNPTHIYGVQNTFNVTLVATHPVCDSNKITKSVNLNHPIIPDFVTQPDSVCFGDSIFISNNSRATDPIPSPYLFTNTWDMGDGNVFVNNNNTFYYPYSQPGTFTINLVIQDSLGCKDSTSSSVYVDDSTFVRFSVSPDKVCLGDYVEFVNEYAQHAISNSFDFGDGTVLTDLVNPRHTYENAGNYTAIFSADYLLCPDVMASVNIEVIDNPLINLGPDTLTWCPGLSNPIVLKNIDNPSQILNWSDGSVGSTLTIKDNGRFWAQASTDNCYTTDSVWVKRDCYLNIPNSFSPNGDGLNDYFLPRDLLSAGVIDFGMTIMNRWGEILWQTNSLDGRGWDGKFGGNDQPVGVYVYRIEAKWKNNFRNFFTGNVTLMR